MRDLVFITKFWKTKGVLVVNGATFRPLEYNEDEYYFSFELALKDLKRRNAKAWRSTLSKAARFGQNVIDINSYLQEPFHENTV